MIDESAIAASIAATSEQILKQRASIYSRALSVKLEDVGRYCITRASQSTLSARCLEMLIALCAQSLLSVTTTTGGQHLTGGYRSPLTVMLEAWFRHGGD